MLLAQFNIELNDSQKAAVSEQLAQAKRNFEVGVATITDTNEAQAKYDSIVAQEIATRNDYDNKVTLLRAIIGRPPKELKKVGSGFEPQLPEPNQLDYWVDRALNENQSVQIGETNFDIATLEVDRARAGHYPTLDLVGERQLGELRRRRDQSGRRQLLDDRLDRRPAHGADLPGRLRRLQGAAGDRTAGQGAAGPRDRATHGALPRADGIHRRHQRGGIGQGASSRRSRRRRSRCSRTSSARKSACAPTSTC